MTIQIRTITVDCTDPDAMVTFWAAATGFGADPDDPNSPGAREAVLVSPDGSLSLLFIAGHDVKTVKNRLHLDVVSTDHTRDQEVDRLIDLGATLVADRRLPDGRGWVVLGDPEGNEFCVERNAAEL